MNIDRDKLVSVYYKTRAIVKPSDFCHFPKEIRSSKMFVMDILETLAERSPDHYDYSYILEFASKRVREDEEVVALFYTLARKYKILVRENMSMNQLEQYNKFHLRKFKADKFLNDKEKAVKLITKDLGNLSAIDSSYISDRDFWLLVIEYAPLDTIEEISYVMPQEFLTERQFILDVASMRGEALNGLLGITNYCDDKEIILTALPNCKEMYENASADLQSDIDVLKLFVSLNPKNVEKITPSIIADEKIIEELVDISSGKVLDYLKKYNLTNKNIFIKAIEFDCSCLEYMDETLADDKEFIKILASIDEEALEYASERVRKDREIVLTYCKESYYGELSIDTFTEEEYKADPELYKKYLSTGNVKKTPVFAYSTKDLMLAMLEYDFDDINEIPAELIDDNEFQKGMLKILVSNIKTHLKKEEERTAEREKKAKLPKVKENFEIFDEAFKKYGETPDLIECFSPSKDIELTKEQIKTLKKIINSTPESIKYLSGRISNSEELYYEALETDPYTYGLIFTQNFNGHGVYSSNAQLLEKIFKKYKINEDTLIEWSKTPTVIKVENTLI